MRHLILAVTIALAACGSRQPLLTTPFDAAAANRLLQPGPNAVGGSALMRKVGGGVVTCAALPVYLIPRTKTAEEWAVNTYGSANGGFNRIGRHADFVRDSSEFTRTVKVSTCDPAGRFMFDQVADGDFFVFVSIFWGVPIRFGTEFHGGTLMRPVRLSAGTRAEVTLAP